MDIIKKYNIKNLKFRVLKKQGLMFLLNDWIRK